MNTKHQDETLPACFHWNGWNPIILLVKKVNKRKFTYVFYSQKATSISFYNSEKPQLDPLRL